MNTDNVKLIRLITGEDLIAEVLPSDPRSIINQTLTLKNPIRIVVIPDANKQPKVGFAPWVEFSKSDTIQLDRQHVLFETTPLPQFLEHYKATFSNLILPQSSTIVLPKK